LYALSAEDELGVQRNSAFDFSEQTKKVPIPYRGSEERERIIVLDPQACASRAIWLSITKSK